MSVSNQRLHHQVTILAVVVIVDDPLDHMKTQTAIQLLGSVIANPYLQHDRSDVLAAKFVLDMVQDPFGKSAAAVFGCNSDSCKVRSTVWIEHYKRKGYQFVVWRDGLNAQRSRFVEKIMQGVFVVTIAGGKAPQIQA